MPLSSHLPCGLPLALGGASIEPAQSDRSIEAGVEAYLRANTRVAALVGDRITPGYVERGGTFPAIDYKVSIDHATILSGSAGYAEATIEINAWSTVFGESVAVMEAVRRCMQGFKGWAGCCFVYSSIPDGPSTDEVQEPKDGSGGYWFCRSQDYAVKYHESRPSF